MDRKDLRFWFNFKTSTAAMKTPHLKKEVAE